jgi:hypothetical protein
LTENAATVPVPDAVTVSGDVGPSCVNTMNDVCAPPTTGENVMANALFAPIAMDALAGLTLKRALLDRTEVIVSVAFPVFVTVTLSVFVLPIGTLPIESVLELAENAPLGAAAGRFSAAPDTGEETETPCGPARRLS